MEAPTGVSLGAMGSLLGKLDALLAPGCRLPKRVKDGMHLLRDDLEEVSAYLEDLAEVEDPPLTAKCWMKSVRELSYDIEDYIDKFPRPVHANIKTTRFVCKISRVKILKRLKWHQQIVNVISEFRTYVQEAIERHERYELDCGTSRRRFVSVGPMLPTPYEETADLVIDGRMSEFVNSLANEWDQQLKVVSVLGPGCIGKTTLAGVLYHKLGGQFDCRAFIRVSRKPDMKRLFRDVLLQVQRQQPPDDCKELDLIDNIRKHLQDKRYLIVLDDLWAAAVWDIVNHAFPEGARRSRIITTTQIEDVALTCCCYRSEYVFEMKPLDNYHSRKLFFNRLFGSRSDCPQQFKDVSNEIVGICGGLPLATINIASLLANQPVILMDLLTYIRDSLSSLLWTNSTSEEMRQVLNLSYNNLPHYLKTCLLYLSMYPEGYTICKDDLVKQWLAEGFIGTTEGRDMEKVAGSYFDELIDRRFIQPIGINYNDEVLSCTVHDVLHDLIAYKSAEENFIVVVDNYRKNVALSEKVRRLSLHFGDAKYAKTPANIRTSQVRSLTFFGLSVCMPSITEFKLLRVLNLQLSGHRGDDMLDLTGISELILLRYLKITCDVCIELPNHMRGLQYLETLDMDAKASAFPWDIFHLPRLLHLGLPVETNLSDWVSSTRSDSLWSLGKLNNLRDLHFTCSTLPSDLLERNMEALCSLLGGFGNLKTLALVPGSSHKNDVVLGGSEVTVPWDGLAPPLLLQRFEWLPHSCIFSRVPMWIGELGNLRILKIAVKELLMNGVDILRGLPALTALSLYVQTVPVPMIVFDKVGFSVLKFFKFRCSVYWLKFEADAMPSLRKLKLGFNAPGVDQHGTAPISIEHLPGLKEISVKIWGAGADAESALTTAVSNHPSNPRIKYYLKTGTCKFGATCKFHHPREKAAIATRAQLNVLGYPLRPNEKECAYYLRTGQCKFASTCKFHHPQPSSTMVAVRGSIYSPGQSATSPGQNTYPGAVTNWSLSRSASFIASPRWPGHSGYAQVIVPQGLVQVPGWNPYAAQIGSSSPDDQQRTPGTTHYYSGSHQSETTGMGDHEMFPSYQAGSVPVGVYAVQGENVFPERPDQPECQFYMKTGDCKFGAVCKFNHPKEWMIPAPNCALSPLGLPLRPEEPVCTFYSRYGICKFGPSCKFDHPMRTLMFGAATSPTGDVPTLHYQLAPSPGHSERLLDGGSGRFHRVPQSDSQHIPSGDGSTEREAS